MQKCLNIESRVAFKWWLGFFIGGEENRIKRTAVLFSIWKKVKWGMTQSQVKKLYGIADES
jgi:hypothetical protein